MIRPGQARTLLTLAWVAENQGRFADATVHAEGALELFRSTDDLLGEGHARCSIGGYQAQLGNYPKAIADCEEALAILRRLGDRYGQGGALDYLGYAHRRLGHPERAVACFDEAIEAYRDLGDRYPQSMTLVQLGETYHDRGGAADRDRAREAWQCALELLLQLDHPEADNVRARLRAIPPAKFADGGVR